MKIHIYTDGACKSNPGPGGYGVYIIDPKTRNPIGEAYGHRYLTTNNEMELFAMYMAFNYMVNNPENEYEIFSDSNYVVNCVTKWLYSWMNTGSIESKANSELLTKIYRLMGRAKNITHTITWVKGHAGIHGNEKADELANFAVRTKTNKVSWLESE